MARARKPQTPFYRFNSSPEVIRLVVMMYVKYPLSLRNVADLLHQRGTDICHDTVGVCGSIPHVPTTRRETGGRGVMASS